MNLQEACLNEIERCFVIAEKTYGATIKRVPVTFSKRMTACAGKAIYLVDSNGKIVPEEIRLSIPLLEKAGEEFVTRTPAHEAAHLIAVVIYGCSAKGHGPEWKKVMSLFGKEAERCHSFGRGGRRFLYSASCGTEVEVSTVIHNRIQKGQNRVIKKTSGRIEATHFVKELKD